MIHRCLESNFGRNELAAYLLQAEMAARSLQAEMAADHPQAEIATDPLRAVMATELQKLTWQQIFYKLQ